MCLLLFGNWFDASSFLVLQSSKNQLSKRALQYKKKRLQRVAATNGSDSSSSTISVNRDEVENFVVLDNANLVEDVVLDDANLVEEVVLDDVHLVEDVVSSSDYENELNFNNFNGLFNGDCDNTSVLGEPFPALGGCDFQYRELQTIPNLRSSLAAWAVSCRVPQTTLKLLLRLMNVQGFDVPLDPRTLLKTPRNTQITSLSYGDYKHFGILRGIKKDINHTHPSTLKLAINIDDVPVNNIVSITVITGCLDESQNVFLIGAFQPNRYETKKLRVAKQKCDQDEFLIFVVDELVELFYDGFDHNSKHYRVMLDYLCSDAPAKAKALKLKGHTGFCSCSKCKVKGEHKHKRTFFKDLKAARRSDEEEFRKSKAIWKNVPLYRLVTDTVLDYMHLVILGIVKRLLGFWTEGSRSQKLGSNVTKAISEHLALIKKYTPVDFVRRCDDIEFVAQWKATQYRQFLLYQAILVLKKKVPTPVYNMFLYLSLGIRILCSNKKDLYSKANKFLKKFIKMFIEIYGEKYCNHNIHGLSHLYVDVLNHGPLDRFSAFRFENYMQQIKKDIRKPGFVLTQLTNRLSERENIVKEHTKTNDFNRIKNGDEVPPLGCESPQYVKYEFNGIKIDTSTLGDRCLGTKSKQVIRIENIATLAGSVVLIGRRFLSKRSFLKSPMDFADLDIYKVSELSQLQVFTLDDIEQKFFMMPIKNDTFLVEPLIHSDFSDY